MSVKTVVLGGVDFVSEYPNPTDLNDTFNNLHARILTLEASIPPIGSIIPWHKSQGAGTIPWGWVLCDVGAGNINDADSPINGQPIPEINGTTEATKLFIATSTTTGTTGGAATHSHSISASVRQASSASNSQPYASTNSSSHLPPYFEVNFIMRYK